MKERIYAYLTDLEEGATSEMIAGALGLKGAKGDVADRVVLTLINRKQITPKQFETQESGAVMMNETCRKTVLEQWQKRKQEEITHPVLNEKMPLGLAFHAQAQLLARHLRGDMDFYPASLWK